MACRTQALRPAPGCSGRSACSWRSAAEPWAPRLFTLWARAHASPPLPQVRHTVCYDDSDTEILRLWDTNQQVGASASFFRCATRHFAHPGPTLSQRASC